MPKKIPATILTGFLGSGKTTILNSIINNKLFKNTLVIVNEFGKDVKPFPTDYREWKMMD